MIQDGLNTWFELILRNKSPYLFNFLSQLKDISKINLDENLFFHYNLMNSKFEDLFAIEIFSRKFKLQEHFHINHFLNI